MKDRRILPLFLPPDFARQPLFHIFSVTEKGAADNAVRLVSTATFRAPGFVMELNAWT
jgi:hypothetical protein